VLIGEIYLPIARLVTYLRPQSGGREPAVQLRAARRAVGGARGVARLIDEYEAALPPGGWPNWVLGNQR